MHARPALTIAAKPLRRPHCGSLTCAASHIAATPIRVVRVFDVREVGLTERCFQPSQRAQEV
jgi:hypothetical protein